MRVAIQETDFELPGQIGEPYHGKVGDVYTLDHDVGALLAVVRTDRVSAFDVILPEPIPCKGQVLNQMSAELLAATRSVAPNWLIDAPDPNVSIGFRAEPIPVEMIVRGYLLGGSARAYTQGARQLCGNRLPDGMSEFQPFEAPILTPTTKAKEGHDQDITPTEIIADRLVTTAEYAEMERLSLSLFAHGQAMAGERGLLLGDTKYEFGRLATGQIVVIDEVHTPDSSRYYDGNQYDAYLNGRTAQRPDQLSKEFVREWLLAQGFSGAPGQTPPDMPEEFIRQITARYIDLYQKMFGRGFEPVSASSEAERLDSMHANIVSCLGRLSFC